MRSRAFRVALLFVILVGFVGFSKPREAHAFSTWLVQSMGDGPANAANCSGPNCRLRDAIAAAASGDAIAFAHPGTITLTQGELNINKSLTIEGPGANLLTIDAAGTSRIMSVTYAPIDVRLSKMTFTGGSITTASVNSGAALFAYSIGSLTLDQMVIRGNTAGSAGNANFGGGLYLGTGTFNITSSEISDNTVLAGAPAAGGGIYVYQATANLTNVTIRNNAANGPNGAGGGIFVSFNSTASLTNVTISGNSAGNAGGGLYVQPQATAATIHNGLVSGNTAGLGPDCGATTQPLTSQDYNLIQDTAGCAIAGTTAHNITGTDPLLGPLQDNGGPSRTMALLPGSPAIEAGDDVGCPTKDQRGIARPQGDHCDIGAFEYVLPCYVDKNAAGINTGESWTDAYLDLQTGLSDPTCYELWVAAGMYYPTGGSDRLISFDISPGKQVYGGFAGTETDRSQRDPAANLTYLDGNIGSGSTEKDNSYHVVWMDGTRGTPLTSRTVVDGFTIRDGYANGISPHERGAGIYCNGAGVGNECTPTLANLTLTDNYAGTYGGAVYDEGFAGKSSPTFTHVRFEGNIAMNSGGALYNHGVAGVSSPRLVDVTFTANTTGDLGSGGGIYNDADNAGTSSPVLANVTFFQNFAGFGGALYNKGNGGTSNPQLANVTFSVNAAITGGAIYNSGISGTANPSLTNVILWHDTATDLAPEMYNAGAGASGTLSYSVVEGGCASIAGASCGIGNTDGEPKLGPLADNGGFTRTMAILHGSSAADTGSDTTCAAAPVSGVDERGVTRPKGPHCDIGAFEIIPLEFPLVRLVPDEGNGACLSPDIGVTLALSDLTRSGGSFDPTTVTLSLDGNDVTGEATVSQTASYPASHGALLYVPLEPITPGPHSVTFTYPTSGGSQSRTWTFFAADVTCPGGRGLLPSAPSGGVHSSSPISP